MIIGDEKRIEGAIDFSSLGMELTAKPIVHGGAAMDYYGLRKRGSDVDFIISDRDYQLLAEKYPHCRKDMWGDLGLKVGQYEFFRSIYRFDYNFFSDGAIEYEKFKVISMEKLFLLKTLSFRDQPRVEKLTKDFKLIAKYYEGFANREYVEIASRHIDEYIAAPNGTIYNDNYKR